MKISIGRFRLRIGVEERRLPETDRASRDLRDHEIAALREAEQGLREQNRVSNSLISANW